MDDRSPTPIAPTLDRTIAEEEQADLTADKQLAGAYYHEAWAGVEQMFRDEIASLGAITSLNPDMIAEEFTIEAKANLKAITLINGIWGKVHDAVESVESQSRKGK